MTWDLVDSTVDLHGYLNFAPDIQYWLNPANTYRAIIIQDQASWFVVTGRSFIINAHGAGGIRGNGQEWWSYYSANNITREDGDGRPVALSLVNVTDGIVKDFRIEQQPFWCNAVTGSKRVLYDGMFCNATNTDQRFAGTNIVPNTDGIDTYRSSDITLLNWDITCGDDCLALKGNSTNIVARDIVCRGGNGIAIGSLGQYVGMPDQLDRVLIENVQAIRLDPQVQPNMGTGLYLKSWTDTVHGVPPTGGGGGGGFVTNLVARNFTVDRVSLPIHLYQTNDGHSGDAPSTLQFSNLTFEDFTGTSLTSKVVDIECSPAVPCPGIVFKNINIQPPAGDTPSYVFVNVVNETGLPSS
ncbi:glycoside hydrolase family 28 protein [Phlebiopsis gigantea 11061_1 CR5-6]|uniref:galacturonan 1,4-alpha-galacturonidase n=1 Tax=Phlebiopsis gigantea (strain 11061_1 CR5-6) TaxID=745531 RepID=A0A0C3S537_PHLG1|nr:glycoside hydrolase family 28 protein [Phlebiopsis gigantea 11061_1 CR5-6]